MTAFITVWKFTEKKLNCCDTGRLSVQRIKHYLRLQYAQPAQIHIQ